MTLVLVCVFFFNDTATPEIYTYGPSLSLHDARPISWIGLLRIASAKPGDTVFVSAAAGAVGSAVVQIAKAREMTVIGSAGGAEKCEWALDLGDRKSTRLNSSH